jgi:hypothetical protein
VSPIVLLATLGALVFTFVNALRFAVARDWSAVVTQLVAWGAGVVGMFMLRAADFAPTVRVGEVPLDRIGTSSTVLLGVAAASLASVLNQLKKAVDRTDSARVPALLPSSGGHPLAAKQDPTVPALPDMFRQYSC